MLQLWMDDRGFFKINRPLSGDFVVITRFRRTGAAAAAGTEGVLFRYVNHTCFLPGGDQVSLSKHEVRLFGCFVCVYVVRCLRVALLTAVWVYGCVCTAASFYAFIGIRRHVWRGLIIGQPTQLPPPPHQLLRALSHVLL